MAHSTLTKNALDADASRFISYLQRGGTKSYYTTFDAKGYSHAAWYDSGAELPPVPAGTDVYFGVNPCTAIPTTNKAGKPTEPEYVRARVDYVAALNCLYAEFDAKDFVLVTDDEAKAEQASDETLDEARERIQKRTAAAEPRYKALARAHVDSLAVQPSVIIDSGGGYHCYWLLVEPFVLDSDETRATAVAVQREWVTFVRGDKAAKDLPRVLRVPGTLNYKYIPARPVAFVEQDYSRLYTLDELHAMLPAKALRTAHKVKQNAPACHTDSLEDVATQPVDFMVVSKAAAALAQLSPERRDSYDDWRSVGMALRELDEIGYAMWDAWSMASHKYKAGECRDKWRTFDAGTPGGNLITLGTLYRYATEDAGEFKHETGSTLDEAERRQLQNYKARDVQAQAIMRWDAPLSAKAVLNGMLPTVEAAAALKANKDATTGTVSVPITYGNIAAILNTSTSTVARAIDIGEQAGLWRKDAEYKETKAGYDVKIVSLDLKPAFYSPELAQPIKAKAHGGARPGAGRRPKCGACPPGTPMLEQTETVRRTTCLGCNKVLSEETSYDERTLQADELIQDETGTPPLAVETNAEPMHAEPVDAPFVEDTRQAEHIQDETVEATYVYPVSCLKKTLDEAGMVAAIQLANTYMPANEHGRYEFQLAMNWLQRGEHEKAAALAPKVLDETARRALLQLAEPPLETAAAAITALV